MLIDPPGPFDTLAEWVSHLRMLEDLPEGTFFREEMIADAKAEIARLRRAMN
jgi:hypothetical protein